MIFEAGDVVFVGFPFSDRAVTKGRPALVVSDRSHQAVTGETLLAMITTAKRSSWPSDLDLVEWSAAGLKNPSVMRIKLTSAENDRISFKIGTLSPGDRARASKALRHAIAL